MIDYYCADCGRPVYGGEPAFEELICEECYKDRKEGSE